MAELIYGQKKLMRIFRDIEKELNLTQRRQVAKTQGVDFVRKQVNL
jgi:hypothetical protein